MEILELPCGSSDDCLISIGTPNSHCGVPARWYEDFHLASTCLEGACRFHCWKNGLSLPECPPAYSCVEDYCQPDPLR